MTGCVVARYVYAVMGHDPRVRSVAVLGRMVTITCRHRWSPLVVVPVPLPVQDFIARFDRGEFATLMALPRPRPLSLSLGGQFQRVQSP
jgi:hypothetical protein